MKGQRSNEYNIMSQFSPQLHFFSYISMKLLAGMLTRSTNLHRQ